MKITCKKNGKIKRVELHPRDTWSLDATLAKVIEPCLRQLLATTHGAPEVSDEDVPECFRRCNAPPTENTWDVDDHWHARWSWVLLEMIWAFEQIAYQADDRKYDDEAYHKRIDNGLRLFGKYYRGLWD